MDKRLEILMIALKKLHESYDDFIGACLTEDGKPKAPDYKSLMKARGILPGSCKNALERKV